MTIFIIGPSNADILLNKAETWEKMGQDFDTQVVMERVVKMEMKD
jgi:hypothetical protein